MSDTGGKFLGFFLVALVGLALDIAIAWGLNRWLDVPLMAAAAIGFGLAAAFNYVANIKTTFADRELKPSIKGFFAYLLSVAAGLGTRLVVLWALPFVLPTQFQFPLAMLIVAAGSSLIVNFAIANKWAFSR